MLQLQMLPSIGLCAASEEANLSSC